MLVFDYFQLLGARDPGEIMLASLPQARLCRRNLVTIARKIKILQQLILQVSSAWFTNLWDSSGSAFDSFDQLMAHLRRFLSSHYKFIGQTRFHSHFWCLDYLPSLSIKTVAFDFITKLIYSFFLYKACEISQQTWTSIILTYMELQPEKMKS
jgi:hypothetical protein